MVLTCQVLYEGVGGTRRGLPVTDSGGRGRLVAWWSDGQNYDISCLHGTIDYRHSTSFYRFTTMHGALDGGSLMSSVGFKKKQCALSIFLIILCRL